MGFLNHWGRAGVGWWGQETDIRISRGADMAWERTFNKSIFFIIQTQEG